MSDSSQQGVQTWFQNEGELLGLARRARVALRTPVIGGYEELSELKRGGQGVVYTAVQRSTRQRVAVKVLLAGSLASPVQQRRFEREAELAASLRHPNIVRIYDSGMTPEGYAYLVMEFVEGRPLDEILAPPTQGNEASFESGAVLRIRVELFTQVCDAVSHAHQRGVIHRDLKPGNVLVDGAGQARVLDFGLAKHTVGETIDVSRTGQFLGSVPWASPEQVEQDGAGVDVRSDVYSLGVMLYQLLTGVFPYDVTGGLTATLANIKTVVPMPPRQRSRRIDEDLSTIALKCLAKEPDRRYQSAMELSQDLHAWLAGEPIRARRDSAWYTLRKKASRYQRAAYVGLGLALVVSAALVGAIRSERTASSARDLATTSEHAAAQARDLARDEADNAQAITLFVQEMLSAADPRMQGRDVRVLDVLDSAARTAEKELAGKPRTLAGVQATLAASYAAIGEHEKALAEYTAADEVASRVLGPDSDEALTAQSGRAAELLQTGKAEEALALATHTAEARRRLFGLDSHGTRDAESVYASCLNNTGKVNEAIELERSLVQRSQRLLGPENRESISDLNNLSTSLLQAGKMDEAAVTLESLIEIIRRVRGADDPDMISSMANLAGVYKAKGQYEKAEPLLREANERAPHVMGEDHPDAVVIEGNLGDLLSTLGRYPEAEKITLDVLERQRRTLGKEHPKTIITLSNLGAVYRGLNENDKAESCMREACALANKVLGEDNPKTIVLHANLGEMLCRNGKAAEGAKVLEDLLPKAKAKYGERHWLCGAFEFNLAKARQDLGDNAGAEQMYLQAYDILHEKLGAAHDRTKSVGEGLVGLYTAWGKPAEAEKWRAAAAGT